MWPGRVDRQPLATGELDRLAVHRPAGSGRGGANSQAQRPDHDAASSAAASGACCRPTASRRPTAPTRAGARSVGSSRSGSPSKSSSGRRSSGSPRRRRRRPGRAAAASIALVPGRSSFSSASRQRCACSPPVERPRRERLVRDELGARLPSGCRPAPPKWSGCECVTIDGVDVADARSRRSSAAASAPSTTLGPGRPGSTTARPRSSSRPYMFTCPSPGIQIGSCIRMTPGATSSTLLGRRLLFLRRAACRTHGVARLPCGVRHGVTLLGVRTGHPSGTRMRRELRPRTYRFEQCARGEAEVVLVPAGDHLERDRHAVDAARPGCCARAGPSC